MAARRDSDDTESRESPLRFVLLPRYRKVGSHHEKQIDSAGYVSDFRHPRRRYRRGRLPLLPASAREIQNGDRAEPCRHRGLESRRALDVEEEKRLEDYGVFHIESSPTFKSAMAGRLALYLRSVSLLLTLVIEAACRDDTCGQDDENQKHSRQSQSVFHDRNNLSVRRKKNEPQRALSRLRVVSYAFWQP